MDKQEREQLKHDVFVEEVTHSLDYAAKHKSQLTMYAGIALAVVAAGLGWWWYSDKQAAERQTALRDALQNQQAAVGPGSSPFIRSFPTQAEKDQAIIKSFTDIINKYPSSDEAAMGHHFIAITYADQGKFAEAEKEWKVVVEKGSSEYAALARLRSSTRRPASRTRPSPISANSSPTPPLSSPRKTPRSNSPRSSPAPSRMRPRRFWNPSVS